MSFIMTELKQNIMIRKFIITADIPKDYTDEIRYCMYDEMDNTDWSKNLEEIQPVPPNKVLNSMTMLDHRVELSNLIDPEQPNLIDTVFTQRIYFDDDNKIMWESNSDDEVLGTHVGVYIRMIDNTCIHIASFLEKDEADNFAHFLIRFGKQVRYPKEKQL